MASLSVTYGTRPPWIGLGAAVWVQIAAGNAYNFPLYSHSLKSVLGFNQQQLALLGVANDIGENVGLLPGLVCNRFPPWVVLFIGALACFIGYGVIWLALSRTVVSVPYWLLWLALCIATNSNAWFTTGVLVTNMRNFPLSRGTVAGTLKGYGGLSAAVYTEVYSVLLGSSSSKLLLFLALGVPAICLMLMSYVRPCTPASGADPSERSNFTFIQVSSIVLGVYVLTTTILDDMLTLSTFVSYSLLLVMVLLLLAPIAIPVKMTFYPSSRSQDNSDNAALPSQDNSGNAALPSQDNSGNAALPSQDNSGNAALPGQHNSDNAALPGQDNSDNAALPGQDNSDNAALPSQDNSDNAALPSQDNSGNAALPSQDNSDNAALISQDNSGNAEPLLARNPSVSSIGSYYEGDGPSEVHMLLAVGEGAIRKKRRPRRGEDFTFAEALVKADFWLLFLVYFVGVGSGVTVLNNLAQIGIAQHMKDTKILLSLFSFCNFAGRLGGGVVSEWLVRSRAFPRTIWMTITQAVMVITYLLFASGRNGTLFVATSLLGICYGFQFSIMVPTASELFGLKDFGMIFNFISLGNPLGAYLFSSLLAGYLYDNEAARQHSKTCLGPDCFRVTFIVLAGVCVVGIILSIVLTMRIRPVYEKLYAGGSFRQPESSQQ